MGDHDGITVSLTKHVPADQQMALYLQAGWVDANDDHADLRALVVGSFLVAAAFDSNGMLCGMGRVISDGSSDCYIQDVVVRTDVRGRGVGSRIVSLLADEARSRGLRWIGLVAAPGTTPFYESLGFRPMKDHVPMLLSVSGSHPAESDATTGDK